MDLKVTVKEIKGHCPTYRVGDSFLLKAGYQLVSDNPVCMHGLAASDALLQCLACLRTELRGASKAKKIRRKPTSTVPTLPTTTGGGTVVFEISKVG